MEWDLLTQNSCNGPEVISSFQKHIRRGEEVKALKCAYELVPKHEKWLWRRLIVIALEDIGPANPDLHVRVRALRDTYFEFRQEEKRGSEVLVLSNVILLMCRSTKSRIEAVELCENLISGNVVLESNHDYDLPWVARSCGRRGEVDITPPY